MSPFVSNSPSKQTTPAKKIKDSSNPPEAENYVFEEISKRVLATVGKDQANVLLPQILAVIRKEEFSGPIAHPRHLREYEDILPGAAERIISMAERNLQHQQDMQRLAIQSDIDDTKSGRFYGFLALIALIAAALICGLNGHDLLAGSFLGVGVFGIIGAFIKGRYWNGDSN